MKIKKIIKTLESVAPKIYQESYDNSGLLIGDNNSECTGVICCLDVLENVVEEAITKKCNLIVAHHPIVFKGLRSLTGKNYIERVVLKAIKNDIAIYAIHTNLDNMLHYGVNQKIAQKLELENFKILAPKENYLSLKIWGSEIELTKIREQLNQAGIIDTSKEALFSSLGVQHSEDGLTASMQMNTFILPHQKNQTESIINNSTPYEISATQIKHKHLGAGGVGELSTAMSTEDFLNHLKTKMELKTFKVTNTSTKKKIKKVAFCGGSGFFLLSNAIAQNADIYITSDVKYHEFFDADGRIILADIGHFESEKYTIEIIHHIISQNFSNFAVYHTEQNTNPVQYF